MPTLQITARILIDVSDARNRLLLEEDAGEITEFADELRRNIHAEALDIDEVEEA